MTNFQRLLDEVLQEKGDRDSAEFKAFFKKTLKKFGVTEPDQLSGSKKKDFFNAIDSGWESDDEEAGRDET